MVINVDIFLQICAGIVCAGGAIGYLLRGFRFIKKPQDEIEMKLKKHAECLDSDNKRLKRLEEGIYNNSRCLRLLIETMHTILSHFEDGNHTKELTAEKKKIEEFLFNKTEILWESKE